MNQQALQGVRYHGFGTAQLLQASLDHARLMRDWLDGNQVIAVFLNPEPFDDAAMNEDMAFRFITLADFQQMRHDANAQDNRWPFYKPPAIGDGVLPLEKRIGFLKGHGGDEQDHEDVYTEYFEVSGDLRLRRRVVFPPDVQEAMGGEPMVLLQYKRFPHIPSEYRVQLLQMVEEMEAEEALAVGAGGNPPEEGGADGGEGEEEEAGVGEETDDDDDDDEDYVPSSSEEEEEEDDEDAAGSDGEEDASDAADEDYVPGSSEDDP